MSTLFWFQVFVSFADGSDYHLQKMVIWNIFTQKLSLIKYSIKYRSNEDISSFKPFDALQASRPWCTSHNWSNFASHLPDDDVNIIIIIVVVVSRPKCTLQVYLILISLTLFEWDTGDDGYYHYYHHDFDKKDISCDWYYQHYFDAPQTLVHFA